MILPRASLAALAAALPLGGCVAAVPAIFASSIAMSKGEVEADTEPRVSAPVAPPRSPAQQDTSTRVTVLPTTELPPPGRSDMEAQGAQRSWDEFYGQALAAASRDAVDDGRISALLAQPGALTAETAECGIQPPAVAIDLDPAGAVFEPDADAAASPRLVQALAVLRSRGIEVAWVSANFPDAAPGIRRALRSSGLDPDSRDELVLLRYPDDRKQDRRESIAETHCLVAIAGDERADFDELFEYLKEPDAAIGLEPLIGRVWFLTPNPLS